MKRALWELGAAVGLALGVTVAVLLVAGADPAGVLRSLALGAFASGSKLARVLTAWAPLTLCAVGLLYTFRIDLWNIGVEGQMMLGAVGATWALRIAAPTLPPPAALGLAMAAGALLGALWAALAGLLKTRGGVNEIFAGLGLNFVAQGLLLWLIFGPWKRPGVASMSGTQPLPPELWLPAWGRLSPVALGCVAAALAATWILLRRSKVGLCLTAVGRNPTAAVLFGLRPDRHLLLAMGLAGGWAGLAGTIQVLGVYHRLIPAISSGYGYLALLVAMLAGYRLAPVAPVALFFAALNVGSIQLPLVHRLDSSLSGVIQGTLVLAFLAVHAWARGRRERAR
ncbi:MAG: ABC transporter permease [Deferrisomatales bacterium]